MYDLVYNAEYAREWGNDMLVWLTQPLLDRFRWVVVRKVGEDVFELLSADSCGNLDIPALVIFRYTGVATTAAEALQIAGYTLVGAPT